MKSKFYHCLIQFKVGIKNPQFYYGNVLDINWLFRILFIYSYLNELNKEKSNIIRGLLKEVVCLLTQNLFFPGTKP